jgi:arylsulfatase A-like enzyme
MWVEVQAINLGTVTRLDDQFGRVISLLDFSDIFSKTITMFFTDHGEYLGNYSLIRK